MIGDELWIDGQKADIGSDSGIYLTWRSNLFGDIKKVVSNYSNTIKLPRTGRNTKIIDGNIHVGVSNTFTKVSHRADVSRNGVPIVIGASLHLVSVSSDSIDVALTWGASSSLLRLISKDDKLSSLSELVDPYGNVYSNFPYNQETADALRFLPKYNQGLHGKDYDLSMPVAPVGDIIRGIERKYGISLDFDTNQYEEWAMPVTSVKGSVGEVGIDTKYDHEYKIMETIAVPLFFGGTEYTTIGSVITWETRSMYDESRVYCMSTRFANGNIKLTGSIDIRFDTRKFPTGKNDARIEDMKLVFACVKLNSNNSFVIDEDNILLEVTPTVISQESLGTRFAFVDTVEFEMANATSVTAFIYAGGKIIHLGDSILMLKSKSIAVFDAQYDTTMIDLRQATIDGRIPISRNLANLEIHKFIKAISQMCGTIPVPGSDNDTIRFVSFASIIQKKDTAYDWSSYLVTSKEWIPNMEFKEGDEGKRNLFTYKDGEDTDFNASFDIENASLEEEKTLAELPFSAYRTALSTAVIPLFEYDVDDEDVKVEFKGSDKPYIMKVVNLYGKTYGVSDGIKWGALLERNYSEYISILRNARVISEKIRMNEVLLSGIDLSIPVYLRQYGAYFGIMEIKTKANNMAEVKLIKL